MGVSGIMNTALTGMQTQTKRISDAAAGITGIRTDTPATENGTGIEEDLFELASAGTGFRANAAVFETGAEIWDLLATIVRD